ncbi:MAG: lmo0937 family membrane protein [Elusimicrobiota bacterium]|nr:lmo0937 family membrane protein [Elusimicrobiota bacterium]
MLDVVILLVLLSWVGGFSVNVGGGLIHLLLVIAVVMFIFRLATGRRLA